MSTDVAESTLPAGWRRVAIRDMADSIQYGHTASAVEREDGPRFLRITDIQDGRVDWDAVPSCDIPKAEIRKYRLAPGDLVFARTGATTGKSYLIADCPEAVFASYLIRVRVSAGVDSRYLAAFFQSPDYWRQIEGGKRGIGQPNVNGKVLGEVQFPLAPLDEQRRIVAEIEKHFTRLDAGVAALRRVQANLKRYRAAVLKAACEGRLVPTEADLARKERRTFESGADLLGRTLKRRRDAWQGRGKYADPLPAAAENLPSLPHGWTWATAEALCSAIVSGSTPPAEEMVQGSGEVPFLKVYNLTFGGLADFSIKPTFISRKTHNGRLARSVVRPGDILTNIVGPPLGKVSVVPDTFEEWNINQAIVAFRPLDGLAPHYLAHVLRSEPVLARLAATSKATAGQFNIQVTSCRKLAIPLPPLAEQLRIVGEVEQRLSVVTELEATVNANIQRATRLRQLILQTAFSPGGRKADLSGQALVAP